MNQDLLAGERPRIESADLGDPEVTAGLDRAHQESDLVHVGRKEGARARRFSIALDPGVNAAHAVLLDAVGDAPEGFQELARHRLLLPRDAGKRGDVTQPLGRGSADVRDHSPII